MCSKYKIPSSPQDGLKATEQKLSRPSDYEEPSSIPDKDKVEPIYEDLESSAQQPRDVAVKMEAYNTSAL